MRIRVGDVVTLLEEDGTPSKAVGVIVSFDGRVAVDGVGPILDVPLDRLDFRGSPPQDNQEEGAAEGESALVFGDGTRVPLSTRYPGPYPSPEMLALLKKRAEEIDRYGGFWFAGCFECANFEEREDLEGWCRAKGVKAHPLGGCKEDWKDKMAKELEKAYDLQRAKEKTIEGLKREVEHLEATVDDLRSEYQRQCTNCGEWLDDDPSNFEDDVCIDCIEAEID